MYLLVGGSLSVLYLGGREMTDFDKIVLSDNDLQYLESARYGAVLRLHPVVAGHLVKLGFLVPYALSKSDDEFVVTEDGMLYADYIDKKKNAERLLKEKEDSRYRQENFREWTGIILSNLMALAALIISAISLWLQLQS